MTTIKQLLINSNCAALQFITSQSVQAMCRGHYYYAPTGACFCVMFVVCLSLSVTYIRPNSRTERSRKIKIGTEVAHVTRDLDTTFKVKVTRPLYSAWP